MRIINSTQMREADRKTIDEVGIPSLVLMENAGREVVAAMEKAFEDLDSRRVAVLCGHGNNGGDGFVVARTLLQKNIETTVFLIGRVSDVHGDAKVNLSILGHLGVTVVEITGEQEWDLHFSEISQSDLIVDGIFGVGLREGLSGVVETLVADVNEIGVPVVSIDLPTGILADTNQLPGEVIEAALTVTMAAPKLPLFMPPAESKAGIVVLADIGVPASVIKNLEGQRLEVLTPETIRGFMPPRDATSHKGDFGHVQVIAGSAGMTGAAYLAGVGALRCGVGLVTVATPKSCQSVVSTMASEYMTTGLDDTPEGVISVSALEKALQVNTDVVAIGPGLGTRVETAEFVRGFLNQAAVPLVVDADALNVFRGDLDLLRGDDSLDVIITPHPGEMAGLLGVSVEEVQENRIKFARSVAVEQHLYVVLKGYRTVVATPEGNVFLNPTGNPGMATGGMGDILTGMIAAWFAQLLDAEAACKVAVYLHGLAGDLAEREKGQIAMTAGDLLERIGDASMALDSPKDTEVGADQ